MYKLYPLSINLIFRAGGNLAETYLFILFIKPHCVKRFLVSEVVRTIGPKYVDIAGSKWKDH